MKQHAKTWLLLAGLLVGYALGSSVPTTSAASNDQLMSKAVGELSGIRRSLERIERKIPNR